MTFRIACDRRAIGNLLRHIYAIQLYRVLAQLLRIMRNTSLTRHRNIVVTTSDLLI